MPISPLGAGDGRPQHWTFTTDSGIFALTGVANNAIAMHLQDINNSYALYVCTGAWNITNAAGGLADFTPSAADLLSTNPLGKPGRYNIYPVVTLASGPVPMDAQIILIGSEP